MRTQLSCALLALLTVAPGLALAQSSSDSSSSISRRYRVRTMTEPRVLELSMLAGRPRIGLSLVSDSAGKGARVASVLDSSPAAKAGLKAGDIITKMNGTALAGDGAADVMSEMARRLEPGDTVKLEYLRGGAQKSVSLVAADLPGASWASSMPALAELDRLRSVEPRQWAGPGDEITRTFTVFGRGPMGLDLVEMNAGLGEYFGTSTGLLVTEAPRDSTLPLRAGDVILSIGGRTPQNEGHAARILGSYAPGETVKFEIMRKRSKQTVSWTVPEQDRAGTLRPARRGVRIERS